MAVGTGSCVKGVLSQPKSCKPAKRARTGHDRARKVTWSSHLCLYEFETDPPHLPLSSELLIPEWERVVDHSRDMLGRDADFDASINYPPGASQDWESVRHPPRASRRHSVVRNSRSAAYALRRGLDLERVHGVNECCHKPAIVIFWDNGVAEKVEYAWEGYTSTKGLPRVPKASSVKQWSLPDALSIKQHLGKLNFAVDVHEFGTLPDPQDNFVNEEIPLDQLPYVEELRRPFLFPSKVATPWLAARPVPSPMEDAEFSKLDGGFDRPANPAMLTVPPPSPWLVTDMWLADTGACEDLCPEGDMKKVWSHNKIKPRVFETANGELTVDKSLTFSDAINGMPLNPCSQQGLSRDP